MIPCRSTKITVTEADIVEGCEGSASNCPIARAVQRQLGQRVSRDGFVRYHFTISPSRYSIRRGNERWCAEVIYVGEPPREAAEFIARFDDSKPVEPFEFEIDLPEECLT